MKSSPRRFLGPLHPLRHPRARHGRGDERHRAARRVHALWRDVPRLLRLCGRRDPALGADGPTRHLRAHPRLHRRWAKTAPPTSRSSIWRCCGRRPTSMCSGPADVVETAEAWSGAAAADARRCFVLSRQSLPTLRHERVHNLTAKGAYVLREADGARDVTLLATGSEVEMRSMPPTSSKPRASARGRLDAVLGVVRVADAGLSAEVLGPAPRVAIEAATRLGWDRWIASGGSSSA